MRYRYLDDFRRGISVFAIFSYGIAVLGTPQCPPLEGPPAYSNSPERSNFLYIPLRNVANSLHEMKTLITQTSSGLRRKPESYSLPFFRYFVWL